MPKVDDKQVWKTIHLLHRNQSVSTVQVFGRLEVTFNNLYVSSSKLNLTAQGFYPNSKDIKEIKIWPPKDMGNQVLILYVHLAAIFVFALVLSMALYFSITNQLDKDESPAAEKSFTRKTTKLFEKKKTKIMETKKRVTNLESIQMSARNLGLPEMPRDRGQSNRSSIPRLSLNSQIIMEHSMSNDDIDDLGLEEILEKPKEE